MNRIFFSKLFLHSLLFFLLIFFTLPAKAQAHNEGIALAMFAGVLIYYFILLLFPILLSESLRGKRLDSAFIYCTSLFFVYLLSVTDIGNAVMSDLGNSGLSFLGVVLGLPTITAIGVYFIFRNKRKNEENQGN